MAQNYACIFYFSNYRGALYAAVHISPTVPNFWGKLLWAATLGNDTIKNNYRFYGNGDPNQPNAALLNSHVDLLSAV